MEQFRKQPNIDPISKNEIVIGGKEYNKLVKTYGEPNKIISPKTGRKIAVNKGEYKKLIKEGYTNQQLFPIVIDKDKINKTSKTEPSIVDSPKVDINDIIQQLINNGNLKELHHLSLTNKEISQQLSLPENIKMLMHITNLNQYYTLDDVYDFDELYFLYDTLSAKKKIYKYIKATFLLQDFERAVELGSDLIGKMKTYKDFMQFQWEHLLEMESRKELTFLSYIAEVGGGFGFMDKEYMNPQFNNGLVFTVNGDMCMTMNR